ASPAAHAPAGGARRIRRRIVVGGTASLPPLGSSHLIRSSTRAVQQIRVKEQERELQSGNHQSCGRSLEAIREHYGWSLAALAARAGLSQNIVKHLLRRGSNPGIASVLRLANAVGIRLSRMLDEQPIQVGMLPPEDSIVRCYDDPDAVAAAIGPRSHAYRQRD